MSPHEQPLSGPLHIDLLRLRPAGTLAMTHCPGRCGVDARGRAWQRDLAHDVRALHDAGVSTVLTLLADEELQLLGAGELGERLQAAGIGWLRYPIVDFGVPDAAAQRAWLELQDELVARLRRDERVLVHCAAGLGRTGTMAAMLLKALGDDGQTAVARVRAARPGTIETAAQRDFVLCFEVGSGKGSERG
jgi:ADP-ribosyl-[dinitrogen reductase] hydrolase